MIYVVNPLELILPPEYVKFYEESKNDNKIDGWAGRFQVMVDF